MPFKFEYFIVGDGKPKVPGLEHRKKIDVKSVIYIEWFMNPAAIAAEHAVVITQSSSYPCAGCSQTRSCCKTVYGSHVRIGE